ncbi:MAG TPA: amino acid ABC transporter substrate-binding protein [Casimicrobiaceae bacterium]|nr:amino acid ABC transporter substrate-binding protein [Casimicrobiaceae bacterium]
MKLFPKTAFVVVAAMFAATAYAQDTGTLKKIKDSGTIVLGTRESSGALAYTLGDGKYVGFHTEMAERIAKDIQKDLKMPKLEVKYQPVTSQNRIPLVQNGTVDLECGSTTNNAARQKDVAFAMTTYVEEGRIIVKANSPIKGIADLNGKTVATTTGTTSVQTLRKNKKAANMDFKEVFGKDHADSFLLLETGRADAFVMDGQILYGLRSKAKNPKDYKVLGEVLSVEPIACMMRKDDPTFQAAVNKSIQAMVKSGELAKMYDKWFIKPIPPANQPVGLPLSAATKNAWEHPNDKPMEEYAMP